MFIHQLVTECLIGDHSEVPALTELTFQLVEAIGYQVYR